MKYSIAWSAYGEIEIEAEDEDEAEAKFNDMTPSKIMETAEDISVDEVEELAE